MTDKGTTVSEMGRQCFIVYGSPDDCISVLIV